MQKTNNEQLDNIDKTQQQTEKVDFTSPWTKEDNMWFAAVENEFVPAPDEWIQTM